MTKRPTILLVEDEPSLQMLTATILRLHFDVLSAATAAEAQSVLGSEKIDLILLDLGLPDEDGLVLTRQIRSRSALPPIIFLTSRDSTVDKIEGLNLGGDDYVTKPFEPDELISRINAVLRRTLGGGCQGTMSSRVRVGYVEIDLETRQVWTASGQLAPLKPFDINLIHIRRP